MTDPLSKEATASDIARAVMSGKTKASDVIEATLTRIETSEPTINAFTDVTAQRARKRAREIDAGRHRGPLVGVFLVAPSFAVGGNVSRRAFLESNGLAGIEGGGSLVAFPGLQGVYAIGKQAALVRRLIPSCG